MRILAGRFKGHNLLAPPGRTQTRPITGRARKSLFDILSPHLADAMVLDLYCGTGTMGLEALSRGARACWFADRDRAALKRLRRNIQALNVQDCCGVWQGDVPARLRRWLTDLDGAVDVAFVDPPYAETQRWKWGVIEQRLFGPLGGKLAGDGTVVLRTPAGLALPQRIDILATTRTKRYGGTVVTLLEPNVEEK